MKDIDTSDLTITLSDHTHMMSTTNPAAIHM